MPSERHHALDLVRGAAAIGVALYHTLDKQGVSIQSLGMFVVYMFFILSALTMTMVYQDRFAGGLSASSAFSFYRNRIARVLPLLAVVALVSSANASTYSTFVLSQTLLTATGFFSLALPGMLSNAGGAWSLGIEIWFYLLAPIAIMLSLKISLKNLIAVVALLLLAQQLYLAGISDRHGREHWNVYTVPLTFAPFFAMGFVIHKLGASSKPWWSALTLVGAAMIGSFSLFVDADLFHSQALYLVLSGLAFITILAAYRTRLPRQMLTFSSFMGDISYAMYLTHPLVLPLTFVTKRLGFPPFVQIIVSLGILITVSYVTFRLFEKPARDYFRSRSVPHNETSVSG